MDTNHNRIKVSDLETDDPDKILVTNSKGELEFTATKNIKVDSYNALDYDQEGKALDARQGKILKDLVNNKTDKGGFQGTAQDLANSIAALEMPDKVLKYGQINLSGLNLSITANSFAWVLNQTQFLTPDAYAKTITAATDGMYRTDIVAGNNSGSYEIIKGTEAATGAAATEPKVSPGKIKVGYVLVFGNTIAKLGNSQSVDLSGELQFPAYPNTRNDGQISINKVLGTDMHGNLKMYTIATAPPPYIDQLIPDSYLPSNTGNIEIKGEFFIPAMCVSSNLNNVKGILLQGQTINYANFINSQKIIMNVTTSSVEGNFDISCNNGLITTKNNALFILAGEIFNPTAENMTVLYGTVDITETGAVKKNTENSQGLIELDYLIPQGQNFQFRWTAERSPLRQDTYTNDGCFVRFMENGVQKYLFEYIYHPARVRIKTTEDSSQVIIGPGTDDPNSYFGNEFYFQRLGTQVILKKGATTIYTFIQQSNESLIKIQIGVNQFDIVNLKYIKIN